MTDVDDLQILNAFDLGSHDEIESALARRAVAVLHLDGTSITDTASFMARAAVDIEMPEGTQLRGWDGFGDLLWQVLGALPQESAILIWRHAEVMIEHSINDFLAALTVFVDTARSVSTTTTGFPHPMRFHLVLLGEGTMFPAFAAGRLR